MAETPAMKMLLEFSKPIKTKPILASINGIGFGFAGVALRHPELERGLFVRVHWFKFIFVPILPLGIYLLSHPVNGKGRPISDSYYIHRAVPMRGVLAVWGRGAVWRMVLSAWGIALAVIAAICALVWATILYN